MAKREDCSLAKGPAKGSSAVTVLLKARMWGGVPTCFTRAGVAQAVSERGPCRSKGSSVFAEGGYRSPAQCGALTTPTPTVRRYDQHNQPVRRTRSSHPDRRALRPVTP